jgi:hypothetical protein
VIELSSELANPRHDSKPKVDKSEILRRVYLGDLRSVQKHRYGYEFPEGDDFAIWHIQLMLKLHALHPTHGPEHMKHFQEVAAPWMPKEDIDLYIHDYSRLDPRYLRPWQNKVELKERIWLTNTEREQCKAWRIPPYDMTDAQLEQQRKDKKRARNARRSKKPRPNYLMESISRKKPWEAEGVSRATWYRKRTKGETSLRQVLAVLPSHSVNLSRLPNTKPPKRLGYQSHPCETGLRLVDKTLSGSDLSQSQGRVSPRRKEAS